MEWTDEAIMISVRPHGENHAVAEVFTPSAGRVLGLVHGGQGRQKLPLLQAGNGLQVTWKGRTEDSLGHFTLEMITPRAAVLMQDRDALLAMASMTSLVSTCLPERQSLPQLYDATLAMMDMLEDRNIWSTVMPKWELGLLSTLGFGLELDTCAATGAKLEDGAELVFVSPKSGKAVCAEAGMPYKDKMLPLPPYLIGLGEPTRESVVAALEMTAFFIQLRILEPAGRALPEARMQLCDRLARF